MRADVDSERLKDALREICKGRLPEDYGKDSVTAARMAGIARDALNPPDNSESGG